MGRTAEVNQDPETGQLWAERGFDNGWARLELVLEEYNEVHIWPNGDSGPHVLDPECPCCPQITPDGDSSHRAYDERDKIEDGLRRPS